MEWGPSEHVRLAIISCLRNSRTHPIWQLDVEDIEYMAIRNKAIRRSLKGGLRMMNRDKSGLPHLAFYEFQELSVSLGAQRDRTVDTLKVRIRTPLNIDTRAKTRTAF